MSRTIEGQGVGVVQDPVVLVLAAGGGTRFSASVAARPDEAGRIRGHKLEQPLGEASVLATTLGEVRLSGLPMVVVTVPSLRAAIPDWVPEQDVVLLSEAADRPAAQPFGMGHSIATGVTHRPHARGWLVLPADMPLVQSATLRTVAEALPHHLVVYAQHLGRRGHPVGFGAELYSELARLSGDDGARRLLARFPTQGVEVPDPGVLLDIDTAEDLSALREIVRARREGVSAARAPVAGPESAGADGTAPAAERASAD